MRRSLFTSFLTRSLAIGIVPVVLATVAHAQAPSRPASGYYYDPSVPAPPREPAAAATAAPSRARAEQPSASLGYRAAALAPVPSGGYYYPAQRPAAPLARDFYAPAGGYPARVAPAPNRQYVRPRPQPENDDDYAYKS